MNTVSFLIYIADVLPSLAAALIFWACIGCIVGAFLIACHYDNHRPESARKVRRLWFIPFAMIFVGIFLPSSNTFYLIAASEIGEDVVTSPRAKKIMQVLDSKLDDFLKEAATMSTATE